MRRGCGFRFSGLGKGGFSRMLPPFHSAETGAFSEKTLYKSSPHLRRGGGGFPRGRVNYEAPLGSPLCLLSWRNKKVGLAAGDILHRGATKVYRREVMLDEGFIQNLCKPLRPKSKISASPAGPAPPLSALRTFPPLTGESTPTGEPRCGGEVGEIFGTGDPSPTGVWKTGVGKMGEIPAGFPYRGGAFRAPPVAGGGRGASGSGRQMRKAHRRRRRCRAPQQGNCSKCWKSWSEKKGRNSRDFPVSGGREHKRGKVWYTSSIKK